MLIFGLSGCSYFYQEIQISNIHNVELVKFENDGLIIEADVKVVNPNFFEIEVVDSDLQVLLENELLGKAKILDKLIIKGQSDEIRHISLKTVYKGKVTGGMRGLFGIAMGKAITITINGDVRGRALGLESDYFIELTETIQL